MATIDKEKELSRRDPDSTKMACDILGTMEGAEEIKAVLASKEPSVVTGRPGITSCK